MLGSTWTNLTKPTYYKFDNLNLLICLCSHWALPWQRYQNPLWSAGLRGRWWLRWYEGPPPWGQVYRSCYPSDGVVTSLWTAEDWGLSLRGPVLTPHLTSPVCLSTSWILNYNNCRPSQWISSIGRNCKLISAIFTAIYKVHFTVYILQYTPWWWLVLALINTCTSSLPIFSNYNYFTLFLNISWDTLKNIQGNGLLNKWP